jgi:hypothetical protein
MSGGDAAEAMIGDTERERLVLGKTEEQLQRRFGNIVPLPFANQRQRNCYEGTRWNHRPVVFIGYSDWMVVFDGDRAVELALIKGC